MKIGAASTVEKQTNKVGDSLEDRVPSKVVDNVECAVWVSRGESRVSGRCVHLYLFHKLVV